MVAGPIVVEAVVAVVVGPIAVAVAADPIDLVEVVGPIDCSGSHRLLTVILKDSAGIICIT